MIMQSKKMLDESCQTKPSQGFQHLEMKTHMVQLWNLWDYWATCKISYCWFRCCLFNMDRSNPIFQKI